jgi:hypothetical protein
MMDENSQIHSLMFCPKESWWLYCDALKPRGPCDVHGMHANVTNYMSSRISFLIWPHSHWHDAPHTKKFRTKRNAKVSCLPSKKLWNIIMGSYFYSSNFICEMYMSHTLREVMNRFEDFFSIFHLKHHSIYCIRPLKTFNMVFFVFKWIKLIEI